MSNIIICLSSSKEQYLILSFDVGFVSPHYGRWEIKMNGKFGDCLLVSDMDATLLTSDKKVSDKNFKAIKYFIENGGHFTVATGRMVDAVNEYRPRIPINAPAILHNGAKLYDYAEKKTLFEKFISEERKQAIKRAYTDMPLGIEIYCNEIVYVYKECSQTSRFLKKNYKVVYGLPEHIWNEPWIKVLLIGEKEELDFYEKIYRRDYDSGYSVRSGEKFLDIVADGVSKGIGAQKVRDMLDIKYIASVGDSENDMDLLERSDYSFAVENAIPQIKQTADFLTPHHNNDAIAFVIEKLEGLLNEK